MDKDNEKMMKKFNEPTSENVQRFEKAKAANFPWMYFFERIRAKVVAEGLLPQDGFLVVEPRYLDSAEDILNDLLASVSSVGSPSYRSVSRKPWNLKLEDWKTVLCSMSASMFDAGIVAALTKGEDASFDPVLSYAGVAIFGDVGLAGLRAKSTRFVKEIAGGAGVTLMGTIGNDACVNLYWDQWNSEHAYKLDEPLREAYFTNSSYAAYFAGVCFAEKLVEMTSEG